MKAASFEQRSNNPNISCLYDKRNTFKISAVNLSKTLNLGRTKHTDLHRRAFRVKVAGVDSMNDLV